MARTLLTVGHSTHTVEQFLALLSSHKIEALCDVRSVPYSQHNPQFNREPLQARLRSAGVSYVFLGKELGARTDSSRCYIDGQVQYSYLAKDPQFLEGLRRLRKGVADFRVALMCAERDPLTCHRTILICRELRRDDFQIEHIMADGTIETNEHAEKRLMLLLNIVPDMFHTEQDCIELAYDKQADRIAYAIKPPHVGIHSRVYK